MPINYGFWPITRPPRFVEARKGLPRRFRWRHLPIVVNAADARRGACGEDSQLPRYFAREAIDDTMMIFAGASMRAYIESMVVAHFDGTRQGY